MLIDSESADVKLVPNARRTWAMNMVFPVPAVPATGLWTFGARVSRGDVEEAVAVSRPYTFGDCEDAVPLFQLAAGTYSFAYLSLCLSLSLWAGGSQSVLTGSSSDIVVELYHTVFVRFVLRSTSQKPCFMMYTAWLQSDPRLALIVGGLDDKFFLKQDGVILHCHSRRSLIRNLTCTNMCCCCFASTYT